MGATSLIQLILKKWGDDAAGAAKELEQKIGFPESVANRIATGELPMDDASRAARAAEQGYGDVLYRGHSLEDMPTSNSDIWATPDRSVAETYAGLKAIQSPTFQAGLSSIRTNASNLAEVNGRGAQWKSVRTNPRKLTGLQVDDPNINRPLKGTDEIAEAVKGSGNYQGTLFRNTKDDAVKTRGNEATDTYNILGSRPDVNIRDTDAAFDPEYTGPNIMGGLLAGGVGLGALSQSEDADAGFITKGGKTLLEAWHGSPHKFDRFSMDQIGTGEGAQAYGHGLYFADSEDVARSYQEALAGQSRDIRVDGQPFTPAPGSSPHEPYNSAVNMISQVGEDGAFKHIQMLKDGDLGDVDLQAVEAIESELNKLRGRVNVHNSVNGHLYRTEIDVTPESLLDWDKPLSEQPQAVQEIAKQLMPELSSTEMQYIPNHGEMTHWTAMADSLEKIPAVEKAIAKLDPYHQGRFAPYGDEMMSTMTGEKFYNSLASPGEWDRQVQGLNRGMTRGEETSGLLSDRGIKGIKYLDGDSRAVGDGTSNYVIFDDGLINIAERGNATVPMMSLLATGSAGAGILLNSLFAEAERAKK